MIYKYLSIFLTLLFIVSSCGLKQPDQSVLDLLFGSAYVTSNLNDVKIFVDYDSTGKVTPDSVKNLSIGPHIIHVFKDGYYATPDSIVFTAEYPKTFNADFVLQQIPNPGTIYVNSLPTGAKIWIDSKFSGKSTPANVVVSAGLKNITLKKNGFEVLKNSVNVGANDTASFNGNLAVLGAQVLIESFANSSCLPCTTTNTHIENFIAVNDPHRFALIEYFTSWPNPLDPMYQHNTAGSSARFGRDFYNVLSVPSMYINGTSVDASDYNAIQNAFETQLSTAGQYVSISLSKQISDSLYVSVEVNELNPLPAGEWRLYIAVVEKHISFAQPPGANGLSDFSHVFRKFVTANEGAVFNFQNSVFNSSYVTALSPEWDLNELQIIAFIQNPATKTVINSSHL